MAIPIRTSVTCPVCGASERIVIADTSVGWQGRVSETPIYSLGHMAGWPQTRKRIGDEVRTWLACAACGTQEIASVEDLAREARGR